jgi:Tol biopolymer transport system component
MRGLAASALVVLIGGAASELAPRYLVVPARQSVDAGIDLCRPGLSADGAVVAFGSWAALDPADGNDSADVYVLDRTTNRVTLVSRAPVGVTGRGSSRCPSISGDGERVAFESDAAGLVPADAARTTHILVFERTSGTLRRVGTPRAAGPSTSDRPAISADGRTVVFDAIAADAAPGERRRVYRAMLDSGTVEELGTGHSATVSGDGRVVAFMTSPRPGAPQTVQIIGPDTTRTAGPAAGQDADDVVAPALSVDGQWITYVSRSGTAHSGRTEAGAQVYVERVRDGVRQLASVTPQGRPANGHSRLPAIDATGSRVVFESTATNIGCASKGAARCAADINLLGDIFLWDRATAAVTRVNATTRELPWLEGASSPAISRDGMSMAFLSRQPVSDADGRDTFDLFVLTRPFAPGSRSLP